MDIFLGLILFITALISALLFGNNSSKCGGKDDPVYFHGSSKKIARLEPAPSKLTNKPVVFGTPSYLDAVIFSATWSDYDFAMWGPQSEQESSILDSNHKRYLEERYPGAFEKLNTIGYIHHLRGDFKKLPKGISNEFICADVIVPFQVDEINILDYLKKAKGLIMHTYDEVLTSRKEIQYHAQLTGKILAHVVSADIDRAIKQVAAICKVAAINADIKVIGRDILSTTHFDKFTIVIGDHILGDQEFHSMAAHVLIKQNFIQLVSEFAPGKTTQAEYLRYLNAQQNLFHSYLWQSDADFAFYLANVLYVQYQIREQFPDKTIIHIMGASGAGKTTLVNRLNDAGVQSIDTDEITDNVQYSAFNERDLFNKAVYNKLTGIISAAPGPIVFCGLTVSFNYLANYKFYLDVDPKIVYERLIGRTVNSICENIVPIRAAIDDHTISNDDEYWKIATKYQIRFPGFILPSHHIRNVIEPLKADYIQCGYEALSADEIYEKIKAL